MVVDLNMRKLKAQRALLVASRKEQKYYLEP